MAEKTWRQIYEEINKAKAERLGISQAEYDSTIASTKFPQFTTAAQKKEKAKKDKIAEDKKVKKDKKAEEKKAKSSVEILQKERTPDKLEAYVTKWEKLMWEVREYKGKKLELAKRRQQSLLKQIDKAGLKQDFHEQILDTDLPDQIMIDPKTKKKYRFVGPDRSDPNSYEEI